MKFLIALLFPVLVFAGPSSQREITADHIKNGAAILTVPTSTDTLVGKATTDVFTHKTYDAAGTGNVLSNVANANVAAAAAIDFSKLAALTNGNILVGNGSNVAVSVATSGDVSLSNAGVFAYNNVVPLAKGGTNNGALTATNGGVLSTDGTKAVNTGAGSANQVLTAGTPPTFQTLAAPTKQTFTSTGTTSGYWFKFPSSTYALGDTYTDTNSVVYTAIIACAACTEGYFSNSNSVFAGGTLTRQTGAGAATLVTTDSNPMATYTQTAGTRYAEVFLVGGGGGAGGCGATGASQCAASAGGGAGATAIKSITNFTGPLYYAVGTGGAGGSAGNNAGANAKPSILVSAALGAIIAHGGLGTGGNAASSTVPNVFGSGVLAATATGGDTNSPGQNGTAGLCLSSVGASAGGIGGTGGSSTMGGGGQSEMGTGAGSLYGGGGAGCAIPASTSAAAGTAGAAGVAIFKEFTQ